MIDPDTRDRLDATMRRALKDGVNLWEALDKQGLIVTPAQINRQWANCLERLWMNLESQPVTALTALGGGQNTPMDAVKGVLEYIDIFQRNFAAQGKE
jgi:hypothetical protein